MPQVQYNGEIKEIRERLARIEQKLDDMPRYDVAQCAMHDRDISTTGERLEIVEAQVRSDRRITVAVSALVSATLIGIKMIFSTKAGGL